MNDTRIIELPIEIKIEAGDRAIHDAAEIEPVSAERIIIYDQIRAGAGAIKRKCVRARPANQRVIINAAIQEIIVGAAIEAIGAIATIKRVTAASALQRIIALQAIGELVRRVAREEIVECSRARSRCPHAHIHLP
jgi:hypothetical protein